MNIFASDRIKPENIKFPKKLESLDWTVVTTYVEFCDVMEKASKTTTVVLDAFVGKEITGQGCAYAMCEIAYDKHQDLPVVMIVGPNQIMQNKIQDIIARSKRWIDINKGRL